MWLFLKSFLRSCFESLRDRFRKSSLTIVLLTGITSALVITSILIIYLSYSVYYTSQVNDAKSLLYLNLEKQSDFIGTNWLPKKTSGLQPIGTYALGNLPKNYQSCLKNYLTKDNRIKHRFTVAACQNSMLLFQLLNKSTLKIFKAPEFWPIAANEVELKSYLINKGGQLIWARGIDRYSVQAREFVQIFVKDSRSKLMRTFNTAKGRSFGFFSQVRNTNLVYFAEANLSDIEELARNTSKKLVMLLAAILGPVLFCLGLFLMSHFRPLRQLSRAAEQIGAGNFQVALSPVGVGELRELSSGIVKMVRNLEERDDAIKSLNQEAVRAARLRSEFEIAKNIQENLIPRQLPKTPDFESSARYVPATEVGGDWFDVFEQDDQVLAALVDVSGHGAGSAIFTAIVAGQFSDKVRNGTIADSLEQRATAFLQSVNDQIRYFGKGSFHATAQIAIYDSKSNDLTILNAGHISPFVMQKMGDTYKHKANLKIQSEYLGVDPDPKIARVKTHLDSHSILFMFSDGLIERMGMKTNRPFGRKRLLKILQNRGARPASEIVNDVVANWQVFGGTQEADDDLCVVCIKAA